LSQGIALSKQRLHLASPSTGTHLPLSWIVRSLTLFCELCNDHKLYGLAFLHVSEMDLLPEMPNVFP
jgi:hypothetical protein